MQVESIAECSKWRIDSAILLTFIKVPFVTKIFFFYFEWPFTQASLYTRLLVYVCVFVCLYSGVFFALGQVLSDAR